MSRPLSALLSLCLFVVALAGTAFAERARRPPPPQPQQQVAPVQGPVRHNTKFASVPDAKQLEVRAIQYDGSTNGKLIVQVRNTTKTAQKFSATGLYFIPEGDPNSAPQRLGAVGPMQMATGGKETTSLEIAPGATVELALDVFCIDSHRASPSPANVFNVATTRLPKELARTIEDRAESAVMEQRRAAPAAAPEEARPMAKGKIQSEVWRSRDSKWVPLDGEGKQEAGKK
jgi:hypothetical protein